MKITTETTMGQMLEYDQGIAYVLMQSGMHCVGCPSSIHESLEEACMVHGLDVNTVLRSIQSYLIEKTVDKGKSEPPQIVRTAHKSGLGRKC